MNVKKQIQFDWSNRWFYWKRFFWQLTETRRRHRWKNRRRNENEHENDWQPRFKRTVIKWKRGNHDWSNANKWKDEGTKKKTKGKCDIYDQKKTVKSAEPTLARIQKLSNSAKPTSTKFLQRQSSAFTALLRNWTNLIDDFKIYRHVFEIMQNILLIDEFLIFLFVLAVLYDLTKNVEFNDLKFLKTVHLIDFHWFIIEQIIISSTQAILHTMIQSFFQTMTRILSNDEYLFYFKFLGFILANAKFLNEKLAKLFVHYWTKKIFWIFKSYKCYDSTWNKWKKKKKHRNNNNEC